MAISLVNVGAWSRLGPAGTADLTITPALPASIAAGDILLIFCMNRSSDAAADADASADGYAVIDDGTTQGFIDPNTGAGNNRVLKVLYKIATGSESDPDVLFTGRSAAAQVSAAMAAYRGVDQTTPIEVVLLDFTNGAPSTYSTDDLTTLTNGAMAIDFVGTADANDIALTTAEGFTERMGGAGYSSTVGVNGSIGMADDPVATAGVVPYGTWTQTTLGPDPWASIAFALKEAPSGTNVDVLPATESEVANPIDPLISREVAVGTVAEAELAQPISAVLNRNVDVGTAVEVELGQPITAAISREVAVGTAIEVETGLGITPQIDDSGGCEFDDAFSNAFATVCAQDILVGQAIERELAQPIIPTIPREVAVGTSTERELANTIDPQLDRQVPVGIATERELAQPVTPSIGRLVSIGTATEVELGQPITPAISRVVVIGTATEVELARAISPVKPIFVPVQTAIERELARVMTPFRGQPFIPTVVCDVVTLPVACEVSSVPVACEVFSVGVDCELVDAYGQAH